MRAADRVRDSIAPMRRERGNWVDVALAAVFTAVGAAMTIGPEGAGGTIIDTLVVPTVTLPLIWRRRDPVAASLAVAAGLVLSGLPTFDQTRCGVAIPAALLIVFSVAVRRERTPALASLAAVLGGLVVLLLTDPLLGAGRRVRAAARRRGVGRRPSRARPLGAGR